MLLAQCEAGEEQQQEAEHQLHHAEAAGEVRCLVRGGGGGGVAGPGDHQLHGAAVLVRAVCAGYWASLLSNKCDTVWTHW